MGGKLRPQFELTTHRASAEVLEHVSRHLGVRGCPLCGLVTPERIELHVPPARQHLWSPELRVEVQPTTEGSRLVGTYGPHPHVWTLYVGIYAGIVFAAFVASVFAFAQWTMGDDAFALYALPVLGMLAVLAHTVAYVGQGLGAEQMDELRAFLERVLDEEVPVSAPLRSGIRATRAQSAAPAAEATRVG
jgi:hypothetical protein